MVPSKMERLRECRVLGMLAGVAAVIGLWLYFVQEIFRATEGARWFRLNLGYGPLAPSR